MNLSLHSYTRLLTTYLRPQRVRVLLLALALLGSIGLQLANPQILRAFIDQATTGGAVTALIQLALFFIGVALCTQFATVAATYLSEQVAWTATNALRADLALHCLRLDLSFHKTQPPGALIERVDGDITAMATFFSQFVIRILGSLLLLGGVLLLLFREDWRVGLALSLFVLVALAVISALRNLAVPAITAERAANANVMGFLEERLGGLDDLRANGAGGYTMRRFHQVMRDHFLKRRRADLLGSGIWMLTMGLFAVGYTMALGIGAYLFQAGAVTIGTVYLLFQYTQMLQQPLEELADQLRELQRASASIVRVQELYAARSNLPDNGGAHLPAGPLAVEFDRLAFGYEAEVNAAPPPFPGNSPNGTDNSPHAGANGAALVLHDIAFRLEPGQVLGLLGRTGSGKTTLTRLIFRLYDPTAGAIRLSGIDLRATPLADLRRRVGIVTQEVQLFRASVRDNLTLFDPSIPDGRITAILEDLGLGDWYRALPAGLDTELAAGGGGLSAGEAQLIAFARVFLRDPGLVILDEASSRLDPATERLIERAIDKLLHNRTGIIIAHRLGTVQRADAILILEQGRIREYGRRADLAHDPNSRFAQLLQIGLEEVLA